MTYDPNIQGDPRYPAQVSNQPIPKTATVPEGALVDPILIPGQPHGTHRFPAQISPQLLEDPVELSPEELAQVDTMYEELKPEATATARNYVLNRTPARYQEAMAAKIEADWPVPPPEEETLTDSRMRDRESYKRPADANPNLDPNIPPARPAGTIYDPRAQASPLA